MLGLDVTRKTVMSPDYLTRLKAVNTPITDFISAITPFYLRFYQANGVDGGTVASVVDPSGLTTEAYPVRVELGGVWSRGQTVVDRRPWRVQQRESEWQPPMGTKLDVAVDIDREHYRRIFREAVLS